VEPDYPIIRSAPRTQETVRYSLRNIPVQLRNDVRVVAALENTTIQAVIENALTAYVASRLDRRGRP
jgi:hypothetical protein